jgi:hypothetical protein
MHQADATEGTLAHGPDQFTIHIDQHVFKVAPIAMTAEELRALPDPPIGPDRDLYLEAPGHSEDELIQAGRRVELKNGMHFFTAPSAITPGRAA